MTVSNSSASSSLNLNTTNLRNDLPKFNIKKPVILIEDDLVFAKSLIDYAHTTGILIEHFTSMSELGFIGNIKRYRAIILDFRLPNLNGLEIAEMCASLFHDLPVVLISNNLPTEEPWATNFANIHFRIAKSQGVNAIIEAIQNSMDAAL